MRGRWESGRGVASGGMALGPVIAGVLLEHFWWGSVFLINVPVVIVALVATLWAIPRMAPSGGAPWDLSGSLQLLIGLTAVVYAIKEIAHQPFSVLVMGLAMAIGVAFITIYLRGQRSRAQPLIDFTLFRQHEFSAGFAAASCGTAGAVGVELALGQHLQLVLGKSPLEAALVLLPMPLGAFVAAPFAGWLLHRVRSTFLMVGDSRCPPFVHCCCHFFRCPYCCWLALASALAQRLPVLPPPS